MIFTNIFFISCHPESWRFSKMMNFFKKGARNLCSNYRGTCILDSLAKLFDKCIHERLKLWFSPTREQAGYQKNRYCNHYYSPQNSAFHHL